MLRRVRQLLFLAMTVATALAGTEADAAFIPPTLDAGFWGSDSSAAVPQPSRQPEAPRPARLDALSFAGASMSGSASTSPVGGSSQFACSAVLQFDGPSVVQSRLRAELHRVTPCRGFLLDILRPPRV